MPLDRRDESVVTFERLIQFVARLDVMGGTGHDLDALMDLVMEAWQEVRDDGDYVTARFLDAARDLVNHHQQCHDQETAP